MSNFHRLLAALRVISPEATVQFLQVEGTDHWVIKVAVQHVILVETPAGSLDDTLFAAVRKLEGLSQRLLMAVKKTDPPPSK